MASTNQSPFYQKAEAKFIDAQTDEERLKYLEEMIKECPKHKSSEKMLANLKTRYKKLKSQAEKSRRSGKSSKKGIKKETMQAVIVGFTNSGKSSLLKSLTNFEPKISPHKFTTKTPSIGTLNYKNMNIQLIEAPAFNSEFYDRGLANTADTLLILVKDLEEIEKIKKGLEKARGKKIIIFNNKHKLNVRKISATLQSKKHDFTLIDLNDFENIEELKEKIFKSFGRIRIFTKEPGKEFNRKTSRPLVLNPGSTINDAAEKILHGFSKKVKESFVTGPSGKFPNQKVGMKHVLKDLDVVEFKTK
jgi:ribosome-interacting GTPase 1